MSTNELESGTLVQRGRQICRKQLRWFGSLDQIGTDTKWFLRQAIVTFASRNLDSDVCGYWRNNSPNAAARSCA